MAKSLVLRRCYGLSVITFVLDSAKHTKLANEAFLELRGSPSTVLPWRYDPGGPPLGEDEGIFHCEECGKTTLLVYTALLCAT